MDKLISVILPCYKVEKYIDKCMDTIVNQTYKNLEIILVDDGSPDNCGKICDEWAKKDARVKVVHKENGGLSSARNAGMEVASGDFITFVDPDDCVDKTMYEKMIKRIEEENSDICFVGFVHVYENGKPNKVYIEDNLKSFEKCVNFKYFHTFNFQHKNNVTHTDNVMGSVWRALIKKEFVLGLKFIENVVSEDLFFMVEVLKKVKKISVVDENLYFYLQREGSLIRVLDEKKINKYYHQMEVMLVVFKDLLDEKSYNALKFNMFADPVALCAECDNKDLFKKVIANEQWLKLNTKENYKARQAQTKTFKRKVLNFFIHHKNFWICRFLYKLKGKN